MNLTTLKNWYARRRKNVSMRILSRNLDRVKLDQGRVKLLDQIHNSAHLGPFDFPTALVGTGKWLGTDGKPVTVYYDPATGAQGLAVAQNVLSRVDAAMSYFGSVFGIAGQGVNVIIAAISGATDGSAGAYHYGGDFTTGGDLYLDVADGNPDLTFGLFGAEVVECWMGLQNKGWDAGHSGGEALSRFLAEIVSGGPNGALMDFVSGPSWDGTDWLSHDQGTDQDYPSIGCGVLYLWWMAYRYSVAQIVQAGEPDGTLSTNYAALTGKPATAAWPDLTALVHGVGGPGGFTGDNPFGTVSPPYPPATPTPVPTPTPQPTPTPTPAPSGPTLAAVLAAVNAELQPVNVRVDTAIRAVFASAPAVEPAAQAIAKPRSPITAKPPTGTWGNIFLRVEGLIQEFGLEAEPLIDRYIASLSLPPFIKTAIEHFVNGLLGKTGP